MEGFKAFVKRKGTVTQFLIVNELLVYSGPQGQYKNIFPSTKIFSQYKKNNTSSLPVSKKRGPGD